MNRFDRALAILLLLQSGRTLSAAELAARLEVSKRTIYRDIDTLAAVGVPVYAEAGREGGYRLLDGYFLPPVALTTGEATSLLIGLVLLDRLRTKPFANELASARQKLLATLPERLQKTLSHAWDFVGFEAIPNDIFHPERTLPAADEQPSDNSIQTQVITLFLQALFQEKLVELTYRSPYGPDQKTYTLLPRGILWDRDHWYLVGSRQDRTDSPRMWRADRVLEIAESTDDSPASDFKVETLLGRRWLDDAMTLWISQSPVVLHLTAVQANRISQDWYYSHARFERLESGRFAMTFGESNPAFVFELLRWLGPGAELISPAKWRADFAAELETMLALYKSTE